MKRDADLKEHEAVKQESGEVVEGYVVDIACLRKYSPKHWSEHARVHSRECALMGHCMESGYGLVGEEGKIVLLDSKATPLVVEAVSNSERQQGIRLQAHRKTVGQEMETYKVQDASSIDSEQV